MAAFESILDLLKQWPAWRRITEAPERIEQLATKVAELEEKINRGALLELCPKCGQGRLRLESERPSPERLAAIQGVKERTIKCDNPACGELYQRTFDPNRVFSK